MLRIYEIVKITLAKVLKINYLIIRMNVTPSISHLMQILTFCTGGERLKHDTLTRLGGMVEDSNDDQASDCFGR
jgi:hypothetical protein